jgi:surface carbohydrate biosynthesis protein (TIGR04326 family)
MTRPESAGSSDHHTFAIERSPTEVLVWDQPADPVHAACGQVLCWQSYFESGSIASVPLHLEKHAESIRDRYRMFIHALGEHRIAGRRIVDHLDRGDGFSLWWMTLVAEKNPFKSRRVYDCLRLIALEEMLLDREASTLTLVSPDRALAEAIGGLCTRRSMAFRWQRCRAATRDSVLRRWYSRLPSAVQGLLSLRHIAMRCRLRPLRRASWFADPDTVFFCSYFIHLDPALGPQGKFHSRQWERLPECLHQANRRTNWLQLFLFSTVVPDVETGRNWARAFNRDATHQGHHVFLESFLSWPVLLSALRSWWWLNRVRGRLSRVQTAFQLPGSDLSLWPVLRDEWRASLGGPVGMSNCLHLALFDAALGAVPRQQTGLYLYENHAWEKALLRAWRRYGHGRIIGVPHSTAPFWYLPHSVDPRPGGSCPEPMPDCWAINGAVARCEFLATGFAADKLVEVEALRYLDLAGLADRRASASGARHATRDDPALRVLVLGEIIPQSMHHLLGMLDAAFEEIQPLFQFGFKAHPSYAVNLADYPRLKLRETNSALHQVLSDYDIAIAGNSTSAAVDAYVAGLPVIIGLHGASLNLSPLRGRRGVAFVTSGRELVDALLAAHTADRANPDREQFFFLDPNLPRWERLLNSR